MFTAGVVDPDLDQEIVGTLIGDELQKLRRRQYSELIRLIGKPITREVQARDGKKYQLHLEALWSHDSAHDVVVRIAAGNGNGASFNQLTDSFCMRPDGSVISAIPSL